MTREIPPYGLRAYALFFEKHGSREGFGQSELDWIVRQSMKKKIFSLLLRAGWIKKQTRDTYVCVSPERAIKGLLEFKVPKIIKEARKPYAFTGLSAIEIWSDFSYVQRGMEKSPYFINVERKGVTNWRQFFAKHNIPAYVGEGSTVGEYIVLIPVERLSFTEKDGYKVISLKKTMAIAKANEIYSYPYNYMRKKYGPVAA